MTPTKAHIDIRKHIVLLICVTVFLVTLPVSAFAQLTVSTIQDLSFGTFVSTGTGGTVIVNATTGVGTTTGRVILMSNSIETQAIFKLTNTTNSRKTVSSISKPSSVTLNRAGGGGTMRLVLTNPSPNPSFFVNKNSSKNFSMGGTLTVGTLIANPAGTYSASFSLTINYN